MKFWRQLCVLLLAFALGGCGGGGGDGNVDGPKASLTGSASGALTVSPTDVLEQEPNDLVGQSQSIFEQTAVFGAASLTDPGSPYPGNPSARIQDLFSLKATGAVRIDLAVIDHQPAVNDLDLVLLDDQGELISASSGEANPETLVVPAPGNYRIGVRATRGTSAYALVCTPLAGAVTGAGQVPPGVAFVPGQILYKYHDQAAAPSVAALGALQSGGSRRLLSGGVEMLEFPLGDPPAPLGVRTLGAAPKQVAPEAQTLDRIRRLQQDPQVAYAEPNFLRRAWRIPDDPTFSAQWHYRQINLPQAWDLTTGDDSIVTAVIDTGILSHPDFINDDGSSRLTAGYDFISDPGMANDGDGPDPDPNDAGDAPPGQTNSYHGTHVAGTLGAATGNGLGVAGVTWQGKIMPLRVLGVGGGTDADAIEAIRYAAGLPNASGRLPAVAARVINMSFGGPGFGQSLQNAVRAAREAGVVLVAAAGNDNTSVPSYPAAFEGVISVSAVGADGSRAPYSNFGATIDVAAPGGNTAQNLDQDEYVDGVLSTHHASQYVFMQGTSMAAPHIAGVVSLMLAANPTLSPADIDALLAGTHPATPLSACRDLGSPGRDDIYGHGLIDAEQAVIAALAVAGGPPPLPEEPRLAASAAALNFGSTIAAMGFQLINPGDGSLEVTSVTADAPWLSLSVPPGPLPLTIQARVDRSGLLNGAYHTALNVVAKAAERRHTLTLPVTMSVETAALPAHGEAGEVFVLALDPVSYTPVLQTQTSAAEGYGFRLEGLPAGSYLIVAGTDRNRNGIICEMGDACGFLPSPVSVKAATSAANLAFSLTTQLTPAIEPWRAAGN